MNIIKADLNDPAQAADFISLMSLYAREPMGGGKDLSEQIKAALPVALARRDNCISFIAYVEGKSAGLLTCMEGFSTFACKPLLNIHDVIVSPNFRGRNIAGQLLEAAQKEAIARGCVKLTLEVLQGNETARKVYRRCGFAPYVLDAQLGRAEFWQKPLS
ncbi:MAG: GNAT family N-acetyltransferase [bacterium]|nr:GNAT family N-acetyltransferase [bacterium]